MSQEPATRRHRAPRPTPEITVFLTVAGPGPLQAQLTVTCAGTAPRAVPAPREPDDPR